MAIRKIPINEYGLLLYRLDCMAYGDAERIQLETELKRLYQAYNDHLAALQDTIKAYELTAKKIKARHPMKKSDILSRESNLTVLTSCNS